MARIPPAKVEITAPIVDEIIQGVRGGLWPEIAAACMGVDAAQLKAWLWAGAQALRCGYDSADTEARLSARLASGVQRSIATFEANMLRHVRVALEDPAQWRLAVWILERSFPERWGPPEQRRKSVLEQMSTGLVAPVADFGALTDGQLAQLEALVQSARTNVAPLAPHANGHANGHSNGHANGRALKGTE